MAEWTELIISCPACIAEGRQPGPPGNWYHADCGGIIEVSDEARLRCRRCGLEDHISRWRWGCYQHGDPGNYDYYRPTNSTAIAAQISVGGAMTMKMGKAWLMRFLENLGDW